MGDIKKEDIGHIRGKWKKNLQRPAPFPTKVPLHILSACLHGGGGSQVGEVTYLGEVIRLSNKSFI